MKKPLLLSVTLCAIALAVLASGCTSASSSPTPVRQLRTYAVVAVDDQGILSQTELNKIVDSLVQYLIDQGYVRSNQTLLDDPVRADAVFRIKIAWNEGQSSFGIVEVEPSYGGGDGSASPPPAYATTTPLPPPVYAAGAPWPYDDWSYDPWLNDDDFGYAYGPYCPFLTVFPLIPYFGFEHHRRLPPLIVHREHPDRRPPLDHRRPPWTRYRSYMPSGYAGAVSRPPLLSPRPSGARPPSWQRRSSAPTAPARYGGYPGSDHHALPAPYATGRTRIRNPENGQPSTNRFPASPQGQHSSGRPQRIDSGPPVRPADHDQPPRPTDPARPGNQNFSNSNRTLPQDSQGRPPPSTVARERAQPQRVNPSSSAMPAREPAPPPRSNPPPHRESTPPARNFSPPPSRGNPPPSAMPAREPAPPRSNPPPQRESTPPPRSDSPPPSRAAAPSPPPPSAPPPRSSSESGRDSRPQSRDR